MNLWIFLIGYGAIQSLLLIYLLNSSKSSQHNGTRYLIALLIVATYIGIHFMLVKLGYRQLYPYWFVLGFSPLFLMPPLYFLFISRSLNREKSALKTLLHFIPFLLFFGIQFMDAKFIFKKHIFLIFVIQLLTYSIVSYRVLNIKRDTKDEIKPTSSLKFLTTIMLLFASSVLLLYISTSVFKVKGVNLTNLVVFFLVVFVTALEMQMLKGLKATFNFIEPKKYKNSNLQSQSINDLGNQLNQLLIDEKVYLNPNLKADDLASMLKISRHQLSEFVNQELDCSFNELVNKYRVEYIKHDLLNKEKNHLSISGLAQDAGFKSDATFYRVFKEQTGFTPSEYIKLNA